MANNLFKAAFKPLIGDDSGEEKFTEPQWKKDRDVRRTFEKGDLVTLSPDFRHSLTFGEVDFEKYRGIVVEAYSNYEYIVVWTSHPPHAMSQGMFNGDHLLKLEHTI